MKDGKPYILLVEDNKLAAMLASVILKDLGCLVDLAETGKKALEMVIQQKYDLIFMDLGLPQADGIATTESIKQITGMKDIPIIALTAHQKEELKERCLKVGMTDFLVKPLGSV